MYYKEYEAQLAEQGHSYFNGAFRDKQGKPKCYNPVFEDLLVRRQHGVPLTTREDDMYGKMIMTLVKIVLNNVHFKHQEQSLRDECASFAYVDAMPLIEQYFKQGKGTAYSFAFRVIYTRMTRVLEDSNQRKDLLTNLIEKTLDGILDCGHKVETPVYA